MLIDGPFKLGIIDNEQSASRELHLDFTPAFRALDVADRAVALQAYIDDLQREIVQVREDNADRQGMLMVQQIAEQLLPYITADEIPLNETVTIEIQPESPVLNFIKGSGLH